MNEKDLTELKDLVDSVMNTSTKKEAKPLLIHLESLASKLESDISDPSLFNKLTCEVIPYAKSATGQVQDKEHWKACVERAWYTFENGVNHLNERKQNK